MGGDQLVLKPVLFVDFSSSVAFASSSYRPRLFSVSAPFRFQLSRLTGSVVIPCCTNNAKIRWSVIFWRPVFVLDPGDRS